MSLADPTTLPAVPNDAQIEFWNGARGDAWVKEQELRDRELSFFGDAALRTAAPLPGERVLDVGCGCGASTLELAAKVTPSGDVLGVDVSKQMLARAKERASRLPNVRFELADAATCRFDGRANLVFSRFGVMFFDDPRAAFANLRTALLPTGRLAFVCWRSLPENPWMNVAYEAVRPLVPASVTTPSANAPGPLAFADPARVKAILEGAGFHRASLEPIDHPMSLGESQGLEAAAREAITLGPVSRILADASDELRERAVAVVRKALEPYQRGNVVELRGAAWVVSASAI
jgi:SAM-dependent methyltransferase